MEATLLGTPIMLVVWRLVLILASLYAMYKAGEIWVKFVRLQYLESLKWVMLEVKTPRDVFRTPLAMEMIYNALWTSGPNGWRNLFWLGKVRQYSTIELISIEGTVYFMFRVEAGMKDFLASQIYAQYADAEVREVDDYVKYVPQFSAKSDDWQLQGFELKHLQKNELMPLKTYVDYGLDKADAKAENQIDPISNVVELMGSLGPGEQIWVQMHVRGAAARPKDKEAYKKQSWVDANKAGLALYEEEVQKTMAGSKDDFKLKYPDLVNKRAVTYMTKYEQEIYLSLQRKLAKNIFDVGVRCVYLAQKGKWRAGIYTGLGQVWRLYNAPGMGGLATQNDTIAVAHPWEDFMKLKSGKSKESMYKSYILRSYFYPPNNKTGPVSRTFLSLTAEELATLFHFPSKTVETPTLSRIEARKVEPPPNLPT